jgi:hypothetical protein
VARSSVAAATAVAVLSLAGCSSLGPIKAGYPKQIPVAEKLVPPPGFVDITDAGPGNRLDGHVLVSCPADFDFGCKGADVLRSWESVGPMSAQEACRRFGTWSYNQGLRKMDYATYPGEVQTWHVFTVPSPTTPQFSKFVNLCVHEVLGDADGVSLRGSSSDLLHPDSSGLQPPHMSASGKSWGMGAGFPNPPKPQPSTTPSSNQSGP